MATTLSQTETLQTSISVKASSNYYGANKFDFYLNNSYRGTVTGTNNGTGYYYANYTFSQLLAGTQYSIGVHVYLNGNHVEEGSANYSTAPLPQKPQGTPTVDAVEQLNHRISVSWTSVSGATNYNIFADNFYKTSTSSTSALISIDKEYWEYSIAVIPTNNVGEGSSGKTTVRSKDETDPTCSSFTKTTTGKNTVEVSASGYDNSPSDGNMSGLAGFYFYKNETFDGAVSLSEVSVSGSASASYTFSGLVAGTTYTLGCRAYDRIGNVSLMRTISATTVNRPDDFEWTYPKNAGAVLKVSAEEFTRLQNKINEFRDYVPRTPKLSKYSFTPVYAGDTVNQLYLFQQLITAINEMSPSIAPPSVNSSTTFNSSSLFEGIRLSLNSIQ